MEARSSEADGGLEEFGADARVRPDCVSNLVDVRTGHFANGRHRVDRRDSDETREWVLVGERLWERIRERVGE